MYSVVSSLQQPGWAGRLRVWIPLEFFFIFTWDATSGFSQFKKNSKELILIPSFEASLNSSLNLGEILRIPTPNSQLNLYCARVRQYVLERRNEDVQAKLSFNSCGLLKLQMGTPGGASRPEIHSDDKDLENLLDGE